MEALLTAIGFDTAEWTAALKAHCRPLLEKLVLVGMLDSIATQGMVVTRRYPGLRHKDSTVADWLEAQGVVLPTGITQEIPESISERLTGIVDKLMSAEWWSGVSEHVRDELKTILSDGLASGKSLSEIRQQIEESAPELAGQRAAVIAATETSSALNAGRLDSLRQVARETGGLLGSKEWISARDSKVRPAHRTADSQVVGLDEEFEVGGELCEAPGDPRLSPENRCNCRCGVATALAPI